MKYVLCNVIKNDYDLIQYFDSREEARKLGDKLSEEAHRGMFVVVSCDSDGTFNEHKYTIYETWM
ncbi:MAG TPA: hypothetical protein PLN48_08490 [Lachnospiraceae bacterium]|nr:hypothetical protein [Lachnospiraceae bacterium]